MVPSLDLASFSYDLPSELIAQHPLKRRDSSRLLVVHRSTRALEHRRFSEIAAYLTPDDLVLVNNTKVLACRLLGRRVTGGRVEALLLQHRGGGVFDALLKPGRLKCGEEVLFADGKLTGTITAKNQIAFAGRAPAEIYRYGVMPLPPYVKRPAEKRDRSCYQTVYARESGAVAAPTAGLHFTRTLLKNIRAQGTRVAEVTLHVGIGTFKPVKHEDIRQHRMEAECYAIPEETRRLIAETRQRGGRVVAVGTTSVRALESWAVSGEAAGKTELFIYPGYRFRIIDCMVTNFHLPRTTLLMMVYAFCGTRLARKAYKEAVQRRYRFYSYGDAMLIV